jgi:tetratricopeptide (TPR) repeat protein
LFLLWGVVVPASARPSPANTEPLPLAALSLEELERSLEAARSVGSRSVEVSTLADLGRLALEEGEVPSAIAYLDKALSLARALGNCDREGDIVESLGLAMVMARQPDAALPYLEQALVLARTKGDRFAERIALERLGVMRANRGERRAAVDMLTQALDLTRTLGLQRHEPDLLWLLAIQHAELGQREQAVAFGQASVQLLRRLDKPQAHVYAEHLERYCQNEADASSGAALGEARRQSVVTTAMLGPTPPVLRSGPGYLQMALSAGKAAAQFLSSGLKTVTTETFRERLQQCNPCCHHIGLRCQICGCFINLKTRLPYEECSLGHWQMVVTSGRGSPGTSNE